MRETCLNKERALNCRRCLFKRNYLVSESAKRCKLSVFSFWPKQLKTTTMINCSLNYRSVRFNTDICSIMISEFLRPLILFSALCHCSSSMLHPHVWHQSPPRSFSQMKYRNTRDYLTINCSQPNEITLQIVIESVKLRQVERIHAFRVKWPCYCDFKSGLVVELGLRKPTTMAWRDKVLSLHSAPLTTCCL